jgi:hypothetical protein
MKIYSLILPSSLATAFSAPVTVPDPPKSSSAAADALQAMTNGAINFGPAYLSGNSDALGKAISQLAGGVASFTPGFFSDLGKAAGSSQAGRTQNGQKPPMAPVK